MLQRTHVLMLTSVKDETIETIKTNIPEHQSPRYLYQRLPSSSYWLADCVGKGSSYRIAIVLHSSLDLKLATISYRKTSLSALPQTFFRAYPIRHMDTRGTRCNLALVPTLRSPENVPRGSHGRDSYASTRDHQEHTYQGSAPSNRPRRGKSK